MATQQTFSRAIRYLALALMWLPLVLALVIASVGWRMAHASGVPTAAAQHHRTLVRAAYAGLGLDAPLATLAGQVHQESRWRADARSGVGAEGLTQFMPATADWIADVYPDTLGPAQPWNPGWALRAMVAYDGWLLVRIQSSEPCEHWAMTLSAYNGGLGWVYRDKRLATANGASNLLWFDHVEHHNAGRSAANFAENRQYVRLILLRWTPLYQRAGWGSGVCTGRTA